MQRKNNVADWLGAMMGICLALLLNVTLGHAAGNAIVTEEFHKTYPLSANGRVALENINGPVHISVWDRNEVKVDAVKSAQSPEELKDAEILVNNSATNLGQGPALDVTDDMLDKMVEINIKAALRLVRLTVLRGIHIVNEIGKILQDVR